jgi:cob(I)alamin adenosyltransferase
MVQLTSITTRGGDKGKTSLGDGSRVDKDDSRVEAIGQVDETNSLIGLLVLKVGDPVRKHLVHIQNDLFDVGADLCVPLCQESALRITEAQVNYLEKLSAEFNASLAPLNSFVLPGGCEESAYLHLLRTQSRRAERSIVAAGKEVTINPLLVKYFNRLSDIAFIWARWFNKETGEGDVLWIPGENRA